MDADFILIRRMKKGDDASFDMFVRKYYEDILKYCRYHCMDEKYAEDLTQETFIRFFNNLSEYQHRDKAKNYLYTIAGNLCCNYLKRKKEALFEDEQITERELTVESPEVAIVNDIAIKTALEQLSEEYREVIILFYFQELKIREIAQVIKIGVPLVKYRLKQGREKLRTLLGEEDISES